MIKLYNGDCLIESDKIKDGSVDLILMDPPYGTMKGINTEGYGRKEHDNHNWDTAIPPVELFNIANRILRKNGKLIMFSQDPYTTELIKSAIPNIPFSYRNIWKKDNFANGLLVNKATVNYFEDILVFSKNNPKHDEGKHPLRKYFKEISDKIGREKSVDLIRESGIYSTEQSITFHSSIKWGYGQGERFDFMNEKLFNLINKKNIFDKPYEELKEINDKFKKEHLEEETKKNPSIFNLWEGKKYKSNILEYKKDYTGHHPTQKPVALLEDLIKTYSNEGNLVVDLTAGSFSTGVACVNTNRKFIGIEMDEVYYKIGCDRIQEAKNKRINNE